MLISDEVVNAWRPTAWTRNLNRDLSQQVAMTARMWPIGRNYGEHFTVSKSTTNTQDGQCHPANNIGTYQKVSRADYHVYAGVLE